MSIKTNKLSMALAWALAKVDQLAISQPPDLEHVSKSRRTGAVKRLRQAWAGYGWGHSRRDPRSADESKRRIAGAQAKRERRQLRNLAELRSRKA